MYAEGPNVEMSSSAGPVRLNAAPASVFPVLATPSAPNRFALCDIRMKRPAPVVLHLGAADEQYQANGTSPSARLRTSVCGPIGTGRTPSGLATIPLHFVPLVGVYLEYQANGPLKTRVFDFRPGSYQLPPVSNARAYLFTAVEDAIGAPTQFNASPEGRFTEGETTQPTRATTTDIFDGSPVTLFPPAGAVGVRLALAETVLPGTTAARINLGNTGELVALQDHVNGLYWPYRDVVPFSTSAVDSTHTVTDIAGGPDKTVQYLLEL